MNTSKESFEQAHAEGLVSACQMKVLEYLLENGTATQREVQLHYGSNVSRTYGTRFKELERDGVIECIGTKLDTSTNRHVKQYQIKEVPTRRVSNKPVKRFPLTVELANAIIEVENVCYSKGLGPEEGGPWDFLLKSAEKVAGKKADSTKGDK